MYITHAARSTQSTAVPARQYSSMFMWLAERYIRYKRAQTELNLVTLLTSPSIEQQIQFQLAESSGGFLWLSINRQLRICPHLDKKETQKASAFQSTERLEFSISTETQPPLRIKNEKTMQAIGKCGDLDAITKGLANNVFEPDQSAKTYEETDLQCVFRNLLKGAVPAGISRVQSVIDNLTKSHSVEILTQQSLVSALLDHSCTTGMIEVFETIYPSRREAIHNDDTLLWISRAIRQGHTEMADWLNDSSGIVPRCDWTTQSVVSYLLNQASASCSVNSVRWVVDQSLQPCWTPDTIQSAFWWALQNGAEPTTPLLQYLIATLAETEFQEVIEIDVTNLVKHENLTVMRLLKSQTTAVLKIDSFECKTIMLFRNMKQLRWIAEHLPHCIPGIISHTDNLCWYTVPVTDLVFFWKHGMSIEKIKQVVKTSLFQHSERQSEYIFERFMNSIAAET
jgi:hypothetical protein